MIDGLHGSDWIFVIDTDSYAGNFERSMCAWITGIYGECEVGKELAELAEKQLGKKTHEFLVDTLVEQVPDDHGCSRPVTIWPNPKWFNDGSGNHWRKDDDRTALHLETLVKSAVDLYEPRIIKTKGILEKLNAGEKVLNWTVKDCERDIKYNEDIITRAKAQKTPTQYPAYLSVGIWLTKRPSEKIIKLFKERANSFYSAYKNFGSLGKYDKGPGPKIEGFRLVHVIRVMEEEVI